MNIHEQNLNLKSAFFSFFFAPSPQFNKRKKDHLKIKILAKCA
uniref:Uncharacterized protein n=1 Tax=Manihot esculenta TaxID=3983 RepID=A0A2C9VJ14_MANES